MKKVIYVLGALIFSTSLSFSQKIVNGAFDNFSCFDHTGYTTAYYDIFNSASVCGLTPWQISHGSPDIVKESGAPFRFAARVAGGKNFGPTSDWGSEGIFQNYAFTKGNRYYLRAFVRGFHVNDGGNNDIDKVFIALTNSLEGKLHTSQQNPDFNFPGNSRQDVWYVDNFKQTSWLLIEKEFVAGNDYSQLWISLNDKSGDPIFNQNAIFLITGLYVSCCPYDKTISNTTLSSSTITAGNKIETNGSVTVGATQNVSMVAGNQIILKPGFSVQPNSLFRASINDYCDCSIGGGNILNICTVFSGAIPFITNSSSTGVYVPNYFPRDSYTYWYPTSFGFSKPYNAYFWRLKIFNRWGALVYSAEDTSGVDGFTNQSIKWNGGDVSTGTYYVQLDLTNCTNTYSYYDWLEVSGTPHPSARMSSNNEVNGRKDYSIDSLLSKKLEVDKTKLYDAYPNPVSKIINFKYTIVKDGFVKLTLANINNTIQKTIISESMHPLGLFEFSYSVEDLPNGIYYYRLQTDESNEAKKLLILN